MLEEKKAKRQPVGFRFDALNWDFLKCMAELAHFADGKYGAAEQYTESRLIKGQGPANHIAEHLRQYLTGEEHDHFKNPVYHLAAIAYNAMMEFYYHTRYGHNVSPLSVQNEDVALDDIRPGMSDETRRRAFALVHNAVLQRIGSTYHSPNLDLTKETFFARAFAKAHTTSATHYYRPWPQSKRK